jgi:hypothetical protein
VYTFICFLHSNLTSALRVSIALLGRIDKVNPQIIPVLHDHMIARLIIVPANDSRRVIAREFL